MNIRILNPNGRLLSAKTRKRIRHEFHRNVGKNVYSLYKFPIKDDQHHLSNEGSIYSEIEGYDPKEMFKDIIALGTNYLFGMLDIKKIHQKFFFLIDIEQPLYITEGNSIICPTKEKRISINIK